MRTSWLTGSLVIFTLATLPAPALDAQENKTYLQAAKEVHRWLESVKKQDSDGNDFWPNDPDVSDRTTIDWYHGDAGVVLFYIELFKATKNRAYLEQAERGANRLVNAIHDDDKRIQPGLFTGFSGLGHVCRELWKATGKNKYRDAALHCVSRLEKTKIENKKNGVHYNGVTDVISGSAGIGMFLVGVHLELKDRKSLELAIEVGDGLIADALPGDDPKHLGGKGKGKRWPVSKTFAREYPNYSHGTAGNCDFLVHLHRTITSAANKKHFPDYDQRFLKAAKQGSEYLVSVAKIKDGTCLIYHDTDNGDKLYYLGWCHGPAGTGRFFASMHAVTQEKQYLELLNQNSQALMAAELAKKRTDGFWNNVGQCCGSAGVGEFLALRFKATGEQRYLDECKRLTQDILDRATAVDLDNGKRGLKWIHAENRIDPKGLKAQTGYMQGAAGIGCWLLRMHELANPADRR